MNIPYDAYLNHNDSPIIHVPCSVDGNLVTHGGESDPFFFVDGVWIDGHWFRRPGPQPLGMWEMIVSRIVASIEEDDDFLRLAMDADDSGAADALRDFREAAE